MGAEEVHTEFWGRPDRNSHLKYLDVDGRIILK
jgi:hypothetical protein